MAEQIVKFYSYELYISDNGPFIKTTRLYGDFNHVVEDVEEGPLIDLYTVYEDGRKVYVFCAFKLNELGRIIEHGESAISLVTTSPNELDSWNAYLTYLDDEAFRLNARALTLKHAHEIVDKAMKVLAQEDI